MITIIAKPSFELQLSLQDIEIMQRLAKHHYDATCRSTATTGFIYRWKSAVEQQSENEPVILTASWHDFDILSKILEARFWESEDDAARMSKIMAAVHEAMRVARAAVPSIKIQVAL